MPPASPRQPFYNRPIVVSNTPGFISRTTRRLPALTILLAGLASNSIARAQSGPTAPAPSKTQTSVPAKPNTAAPTQTQTQPQANAAPSAAPAAADIRQTGGRLVLVLPFDNRSGQANLNWIGDSFPYTLDERLASAGFLPISRDDRQYALDHLGLPPGFKPSRATTIRIAQTLDADFVIVGSYNVAGGTATTTGAAGTAQSATQPSRIAVQAQVLDVNRLRMSAPLQDSSELTRLFDVENAIAWKIAQKMDPHFAVAEQTFLAAAGGVRLSSFEDYIRGTSATTEEERLKRLKAAVAETPGYSSALLALGKEEYAARQYDAAAATLAKIQPSDRVALEAGFYLGLARFNNAKYAEAASAFAFVGSRLPLPEVVNDQGVAASRQGKDATPLFEQVVAADPSDPDYHFNLAVALLRRSDIPGALREVETALKLHSADPEAAQLLARLQSTHGSTANLKAAIAAGGFDPTARIRRTWSEASFRQAAFQLDQIRAIRVAALPPAEQAVQYAQSGQDYLAQGLLPEAEQEFQSALSADPKSAAAHAGIAMVRERSDAPEDARSEAQLSLKLGPNVAAYLVLARLDLQGDKLSDSAGDVANALRLEPGNSAALGMKTALAARGQALP
jgi:tetratricopeptide (TPR) repeat protein/cell division septation protein DedD